KRAGERVRGRSRKLRDQPAVPVARLDEQGRPAVAACVEVQHETDIVDPRMLIHKGRGAQQTTLLTIGDEHDHIVSQPWPGTKRTERFEPCSHARPIVPGPRSSRHRIVVAHEQDRLAQLRPRHPSDDILEGDRLIVPYVPGLAALNLWLNAEFVEYS